MTKKFMKDLIHYEDRFFIRLQELMSEHAQKQILITERSEIYYFFMYRKYKICIKKARKEYKVIGQNMEELNNLELFDKIPILEMKQFYNTYFKGTLLECIDFYNKIIERGIKNGLFISTKTRNQRQKRKRIES